MRLASAWARMVEVAQAKADTGKPVLVIGPAGNYYLQPSKEAVDATLARMEAP
jgi:hypothetical protein